jgi:hypothetical protein
MSEPLWVPSPPYADPPAPRSTLPPGARALLNRMQARVEEDMARYPAFAEAVRRHAAQAEAERAGPSPAADK